LFFCCFLKFLVSEFQLHSQLHFATDTIDSDSDDEAVKSKNLVQYTTYKLEKRKRKLEREIDTQKEKLKTISTKIGHYSIRNVNKRDEKSKQNTRTKFFDLTASSSESESIVSVCTPEFISTLPISLSLYSISCTSRPTDAEVSLISLTGGSKEIKTKYKVNIRTEAYC
jgi:hypothetical protein